MVKSTTKKSAGERGTPPQHKSLLQILRPLVPGVLPRFEFDMGLKEYGAIGYAIVHWAFLEEAIFKRTVLFAKRGKVRTLRDAYLTGHLAILDSIPTAEANSDQTLSAQSGPETVHLWHLRLRQPCFKNHHRRRGRFLR
jgi:hypothetical protein